MSPDGEFLDARTVRFERLLPGPIELVWDFLTQPKHLATWLAEADFDTRPGGAVELRFTLSVAPEDAGVTCKGVVRRCEPPRHLSFTWREGGSGAPELGPESEVSFDLAPQGGEVLLVLTHRRLPSDELPGFGGGWHAHLDYLAARMSGAAVEPYVPLFQRLRPLYVAKIAAGKERSA